MKIHDLTALAAQAVAAHRARPATTVVHDSPDARVVLFRIESGQAVAVHTSPSSVILCVIAGSGLVSDGDSDVPVKTGDIVSYAPKEPHGMRATSTQLVIAAVIAPRASTRSSEKAEIDNGL